MAGDASSAATPTNNARSGGGAANARAWKFAASILLISILSALTFAQQSVMTNGAYDRTIKAIENALASVAPTENALTVAAFMASEAEEATEESTDSQGEQEVDEDSDKVVEREWQQVAGNAPATAVAGTTTSKAPAKVSSPAPSLPASTAKLTLKPSQAFTIDEVSSVCLGASRPLVFGHKWPDTPTPSGAKKHAAKVAANLKLISGGGRRRRRLLASGSSKPFQSRCNAEKGVGRGAALSDADEMAAACIKDPTACADVRLSRSALRGLASMSSLRKRVACLTSNTAKTCAENSMRLASNPETGKFVGPERMAQIKRIAPRVAHPGMFETCALIGNGPGLRDESKPMGAIIDRHDAVFKSNLYLTAERPGSWADHKGILHGEKSTFRMFNKKRAEVASTWTGDRAFTPGKNETWLFWHYGSGAIYDKALKRNPGRVFLLSPQLISAQVEAYFALRRELLRLKVFNSLYCPMNMPSGLHTLLMAIKMCKRVNLFGFSYSIDMLQSRSDGPSPRVSAGHAWDADTSILAMLALAGHINLCTT